MARDNLIFNDRFANTDYFEQLPRPDKSERIALAYKILYGLLTGNGSTFPTNEKIYSISYFGYHLNLTEREVIETITGLEGITAIFNDQKKLSGYLLADRQALLNSIIKETKGDIKLPDALIQEPEPIGRIEEAFLEYLKKQYVNTPFKLQDIIKIPDSLNLLRELRKAGRITEVRDEDGESSFYVK